MGMRNMRWLACLLSLALPAGLTMAAASAQAPDRAAGNGVSGMATVYVGGEAMTAGDSTESWYTASGVVAAEPAAYSAHLYLDDENGGALTLEIKNLTASGKENHAQSKGAGIYTTEALTVRYGGKNTVTAAAAYDYTTGQNRRYDVSCGIFANGLTLIGDAGASLSVTSRDVKGNSYGIHSTGALTARGGSITAVSGDTVDIGADWNFSSVGIHAEGAVLLTDGVRVYAAGGNAYAGSYRESQSAGIMSVGDMALEGCSVEAVSLQAFDEDANTPRNYTYMRYSRGLYAQYGDITITNSSVIATGGDAYGDGNSTDSSVGILSFGGNITIHSGTVTATGGNKGADPSYGICARQSSSSSTTEGILTINGGTVHATGGDTRNSSDWSAGLYAFNGIAISGGTVTAEGGKGMVSAGIDCDWNLTVSNDARVYATADEARVYSYGIKVWNDYHQSGSAQVHAAAANTFAAYTGALGTREPRSYGFYMGDSYNEQAGRANTFTITGGIFEAQSRADGNSTTVPSAGGGNLGGREHALKFFDVKDDAATFADGVQPNAEWYWWTLDPAHAAQNRHISPDKACVYDDAEDNYLSKYLYIAPIGPETGDLRLTKEVSGEGADTERAFSFTVTLSDRTISGTYGDMVFDGGVAAVRAKHGQTVTAAGLPAGVAYAITETEANRDGYTTSSVGETGTIPKDGVAEAVFTNHKESVAAVTQVSVEKIWKLDDGGAAAGSVTVALLQNGAQYAVATLEESNGWSHTWAGLDARYSWTVREIDVPNGFKASVERISDNRFVITNDDLPAESPVIPDTGDSSDHALWCALLVLSGAGMAGLAVWRKRTRGCG